MGANHTERLSSLIVSAYGIPIRAHVVHAYAAFSIEAFNYRRNSFLTIYLSRQNGCRHVLNEGHLEEKKAGHQQQYVGRNSRPDTIPR